MVQRFLSGVVTLAAVMAASTAGHAAPPPARHALPPGVLSHQAALRLEDVRARCLKLPASREDQTFVDDPQPGVAAPDCVVLEAGPLAGSPGWTLARYRWAAPTLGEVEEVVLLEAAGAGRVRPVWHARFTTQGDEVVWRSLTPEVAPAGKGGVLLSTMYCVNGTGGCSQEFLLRGPDGGWTEIRQAWLDQLPPGYSDRIRHGVRIDPRTLRGEAAFYGDDDANCCASQRLSMRLALRGDALVLLGQSVSATPGP